MEQWDISIPVIHGDFKVNAQYPSNVRADGLGLLVLFVSGSQTVDLSYTVEAEQQKLCVL